jgi:hypothetical protein
MDERKPADERRGREDERPEGLPPERPITEWTREAEERGDGEETPGLDVPPG